jgi:hypothetical protein
MFCERKKTRGEEEAPYLTHEDLRVRELIGCSTVAIGCSKRYSTIDVPGECSLEGIAESSRMQQPFRVRNYCPGIFYGGDLH